MLKIVNFQVNKLLLPDVTQNSVFILAVIFLLGIATLRKRTGGRQLLDRTETAHLKGLAILMVIHGHIWVHVTASRPTLFFSRDAVTMFLLLSGFGLTRSFQRRIPSFKTYVNHRLSRVLVPYWITTILILLLDYGLLEKSYSALNLLMTFAGVNFGQPLRSIDFVRWYVTFIIIWYLLFFISFKLSSTTSRAVYWLLCILVLVFINHQYRFAYQFFAFPVGSLLASKLDTIQRIYRARARILLPVVLVIIMSTLFYKATITNILKMPGIGVLTDIVSVMFCLAVIYLNAMLFGGRYESLFFTFCGAISYELFLLHGPFLIKYNPIFAIFDLKYFAGSFFIYLGLVALFAVGLSYAVQRVQRYSWLNA